MSESDGAKPQAQRASRLSGLIAPKGAASRPSEPSATALEPAPQPRPAHAAQAPVPAAGTGSKSLTLRLPDSEYERLRTHAFATRQTHQAVLAEALRRYLDEALRE